MTTTTIDPIYPLIGARIKEARLRARVTQGALAYIIGYERPVSISEYEKGKVRIPVDAIYAIARVLRCSVHDLLPPEDESEVI